MEPQYHKANGVYSIRFAGSNWVYVGSTAKGLKKRRTQHIYRLRTNKHPNRHLQHAYNIYGMADFVFTVLEVVDDPTQLLNREQYWMDIHRKSYELYNILPEAGKTRGRKGRPLTAAEKENIRTKLKGRKATEAHKQAQRDGWTPAARAAAAAHKRGKKMSEQMRQKTAARMRGNMINLNRGKAHAGFVSPAGVVYRDIANLRLFCDEHGLNVQNMRAVSRGAVPRHKGWTKVD